MRFVTRRRAALVATLLVALGITACGKKDAERADTAMISVPPVSAPLRVTDVQLGKSVGSGKRVVAPTTTFGRRDTVYVSVTTEGAATDARLTATWMYGEQGVSEADEMLSPTGGTNVSEFHITKDTPWPAGDYKVDIKLNGAVVESKEFRIQ